MVLSQPPYLGAGEDGVWAPLPPAPPSAPPPAKPGVTAIARPLSGRVEVNPTHPLASAMTGEMSTPMNEAPGQPTPASRLTHSVEVPVNSTYNATQGVVKLTVASDVTQHTSTAIVSGGRFRLAQRTSTAVPLVRLVGEPQGCGRGRASIARRARRQPRLRGHTRGRWEGAGNGDNRFSSGGTVWEIENTCRGTLYRAIEHDLVVTDPHRRRPILVTAGHQYLVLSGGGSHHA
jgi:hypothetical protein